MATTKMRTYSRISPRRRGRRPALPRWCRRRVLCRPRPPGSSGDEPATTRSSSTPTTPIRTTRSTSSVQSTIVEAMLPGVAPGIEIDVDRVAEHVPGLCDRRSRQDDRSGSRCSPRAGRCQTSRSMASGWSGIRRATVDRLSPRSHRRLGCWRQIKVSPPGQNSAASARISVGQLGGQRTQRVGAADQHRRRHRPTAALRAQQPAYAGGVERVGRQPVDGVGRHHDQTAPPERHLGLGETLHPPRRVVQVVDVVPRLLDGDRPTPRWPTPRRASPGASARPASTPASTRPASARGSDVAHGPMVPVAVPVRATRRAVTNRGARRGRGGHGPRTTGPSRRTPGRRLPLHVGVLAQHQAAVDQRAPRRRAATRRIASRPSSPDHSATSGSWLRASSSTHSQASSGMYGGLAVTTWTRPARSESRCAASARSPTRTSTAVPCRVPLGVRRGVRRQLQRDDARTAPPRWPARSRRRRTRCTGPPPPATCRRRPADAARRPRRRSSPRSRGAG